MRPADYPFWLRVVVVINLLLLAVNAFFFLGPLMHLALALDFTAKNLAVWIGSLFSTFIGAFLAFRFGLHQRERERIDKEVMAGNLALWTLSEIWDRQTQWQQDVIRPSRGRHDVWLNLDVGTPLSSMEHQLDAQELAFLLQQSPQVWQKAVLEASRFNRVKRLIDERKDLVLKEAWPRMAQAGIVVGTQMSEADMERILGPAIVQQLRKGAEGIIKLIDENVETSFAAFTAVRDALLQIHSGRKFIRLQRLPSPGGDRH